MIDHGVALQQVEPLEIEDAPARQDEHREEVGLPLHLLHQRSRYVQRGMRDQVNHRVALVARPEKRDLRGQLREDASRVASALALEAEEPGRRELRPVARPLHVVEARVEEAHPHLFPGELELLAERDGQAPREDLALPAHGGRRVDDQVVKAPGLVRRLLARVKE